MILELCFTLNQINGYPGFIDVIFKDNENNYYMQNTNNGRISSFLRVRVEGGADIRAYNSRFVGVGDEELIAFRFIDANEAIGTFDTLKEILANSVISFIEMPFILLEIAEFLGDDALVELAQSKICKERETIHPSTRILDWLSYIDTFETLKDKQREARDDRTSIGTRQFLVTPAMVKDLSKMTGAGMMDCKNALNESGGDIEAAIDWLRKKGLSKAAKKSGRVAAEGLVGVAVSGVSGVVVEVNSETDFVARNEEFQALVKSIALVAVEKGESDVEALKNQHYPAGAATVAHAISNAIATIGENMTLRRVATLSVSDGVIGQYIHNSIGEGLGKIGVIVALESTGDKEQLAELGRKIAMHVAAASPLALDASSLDPATVEREKNALRDKNAGRPAHVLEKIVESGLKTYYKEVTLIEQPYIFDCAKTVSQAVAEAAKAVGALVALKGFVRYALGEGIEKQEADFAAEVAAAASDFA